MKADQMRPNLLRVFTLLLICLSWAAQAQTAYKFPSRDVFDMDGNVGAAKEFVVPGVLTLPTGTGPFPAVVISNSSAGTGDRVLAALQQDLPKHGYAVFAIQSFGVRGVEGSVQNRQLAVSAHGPAVDALYALEFLRSRPEVDPNRICVAGHSRGAATAFNFTYFTEFISMSGFPSRPFDCNVSVNFGGFIRPENEEMTMKPILVMLGEKDDTWDLAKNVNWISKLKAKNENMKLVVMPNTYHSLVSTREWCPRANTFKKCEAGTYGKNGSYYLGKPTTAIEFAKACMSFGSYCGYGTMDKYPYTLDLIVQFLNEHIGPNSKLAQTKTQ